MKYLFRPQVKLLFPRGQAQELHYLKQHFSETLSLSLKLFLKTSPPYTPDFLVFLKFHQCFSTSFFYICWMFILGANFNMGFCFFWMVKECSHKQTLYTHSYQMCLVFISSFRNIPVMMTFRYISHIYDGFLTNVFHPKMQRTKLHLNMQGMTFWHNAECQTTRTVEAMSLYKNTAKKPVSLCTET